MHMGYHKTYCNFKEYFMGGLGVVAPQEIFLKIQEIFARINIVALLIKASVSREQSVHEQAELFMNQICS